MQLVSPDGTVLAMDQLGSGPPLVLVSGAACDRRQDAPIAAALARHFTVLTYDRRGRGESTEVLPFAVEREIEDLGALLDAAGSPAVVVGMSSGAALATRAAAGGLPIRLLVMWEVPYVIDDAAVERASRYSATLRERLDAGDRAGAVTAFLQQVGMPEEAIAGMSRSPGWQAMLDIAPTLAYDDAAMGDGRIPHQMLARIDAPALVLAGGESPGWFRSVAREVAAAIPRGRYGELPGQTHAVAADALAAAVSEDAAPGGAGA